MPGLDAKPDIQDLLFPTQHYSEVYKDVPVTQMILEAYAHQKYGEWQKAEHFYLHVLLQQPDNFDALYNLAVIANETHKPNIAMVYAHRASKINPYHADTYYELGIAVMAHKAWEEAASCFSKALQLSPFHLKSTTQLGRCFQYLHRWQEAIDQYKKALGITSNQSDILYHLGQCYEYLGQFENARKAFDRAYRLQQDSVEKNYHLLFNLLRMGEINEIILHVRHIKQQKLLSGKQMTGIHVIEALIRLLHNDWEKCHNALAEIRDMENTEFSYPHASLLMFYGEYIKQLVHYKIHHPAYYHTPSTHTLYLVGGSECLAPAYTTFHWKEAIYTCVPRLVFNAAMEHFLHPGEHRSVACFTQLFQHIPDYAECVFMFGEKDCHIQEGLLRPHHPLAGYNAVQIRKYIEDMVTHYVHTAIEASAEKHITPYFCGIPAPGRVNHSRHDLYSIEQQRYIVRIINDILRAKVYQSGYHFIDLYQLTANEDGSGNPAYFLSPSLLAPHRFIEACQIMGTQPEKQNIYTQSISRVG